MSRLTTLRVNNEAENGEPNSKINEAQCIKINKWFLLEVIMGEIHDWIFLGIVFILSVACAIITFVTPLKNNKRRKFIKRASLVLFIITAGYLLFCFVFMYLWQNHYKIL